MTALVTGTIGVLFGASLLAALVVLPGIVLALCLRRLNQPVAGPRPAAAPARGPERAQARFAVAPVASSGGRNVS
jgi:hypothetical protein